MPAQTPARTRAPRVLRAVPSRQLHRCAPGPRRPRHPRVRRARPCPPGAAPARPPAAGGQAASPRGHRGPAEGTTAPPAAARVGEERGLAL